MSPLIDQAGHDIRGRSPRALKTRRRAVAVVDLLAAAAGVTAGEAISGRLEWLPPLICVALWLVSTGLAGTLASGSVRMRRQAVATLVAATGLVGVLAIGVLAVIGNPSFALIFTAVTFALALMGRLVLFGQVDRAPLGIALLCDADTAIESWPRLSPLLGPGYRVNAILDIDAPNLFAQLVGVLSVRSVDLVVATQPEHESPVVAAALHFCRVRSTSMMSFQDLYEDLTGRCFEGEAAPLEELPGTVWRSIGPRVVDVVAALLLIPLWVVGTALGRATGGFATQKTVFVGRGGAIVTLRLFVALGKEERLLARLFCSSALRWAPSAPQLLIGRLAVVGPAPIRSHELGSGHSWQFRQQARPGVTGWASINGFTSADASLPYDLYYVRHRSFSFDLGILLRACATPVLSWRELHRSVLSRPRELETVSRNSVLVSTSQELISVIVPAFREGAHIAASLTLLIEELSSLGAPFEVIVVSDGNTDGTELEARSVRGPVTVIHYPNNRGKGYAIRRGLAESRGDRVVFIDADMELHPQGIGSLLALLDAGADVAIGSKRHPGSNVRYPAPRRLQSLAYQWLVRRLFGLDVTDTQTGIKAFRGELVRGVAPLLTNEGFSFDLELLVELKSHGAIVAEGPVTLTYRFRSTTSLAAVIDVLRETLRLWHKRRREILAASDVGVPGPV